MLTYMKHTIYLIFLLLFLFVSCLAPRYSEFPRERVTLGADRANVVGICGRPFRADTYMRGGKKVDVLYYKEPARVLNEGFFITTALTFENDSLVSIRQYDKHVSEIGLSVDSI